MSVRRTLQVLRDQGGEATLTELLERDARASMRLRSLIKQRYVERVSPGRYRLTEAGR